MNIEKVLDARVVQRFHTLPVIRAQSIADHSWGVAAIAYHLSQGRAPASALRIVVAALMHDVGEKSVGDTPAHVKRAHPALKDALDAAEDQELRIVLGDTYDNDMALDEHAVVKMADGLDLMHYCMIEMRMGNTGMRECFERAAGYVRELLHLYDNPWARDLRNAFIDTYQEDTL